MSTNREENTIKYVKPGSPAHRAKIKPGMKLLSINGHEIKDIFDLHFYSDEGKLKLTVLKEDKNEDILLYKQIDEELGISFENALLDGYHSCTNKCIFCFIDQMPKGLRPTLYFKDDDTRLSFLQGNYVTLTNVSDDELGRIIKYRLAPVNISVHATDPEVRRMMLNNRFAGDILEKMKKLADAKLPMNAQIVLCKGINDGKILNQTLEDLFKLHPFLKSVSVVPVGLTRYRQGLFELKAYEKEDAKNILSFLQKKNKILRRLTGKGFVYPADEWFLMCNRGFPGEKYYDGYPQLENGVGMMRLMIDEFRRELIKSPPKLFLKTERPVVVTGVMAAPVIKKLCEIFTKKYPQISPIVFPVINHFFGEKVTVSGLVTGQDIIKQLKGKVSSKRLFIPVNMLRHGEKVFLDDVSITDLESALHVKAAIVKSDGGSLVRGLLRKE